MCDKPGDGDHGVDFDVKKLTPLRRGGAVRYLESGQVIQLQLKATTQASVIVEEGHVRYDLEAKTYNDLVDRRTLGSPLYLCLCILPNDNHDWLSLCERDDTVEGRLHLTGKFFWYRPPENGVHTNNVQSIRIAIPLANRMTLAFFDDAFRSAYE